MEPTPMTFQSPQFVIIVLLILLAGAVCYMTFSYISKARDDGTANYDPAKALTNSIMGMVWLLILFTGGIIAAQIIDRGSANTESWAAFTGIIGWATAKAGDIFNNRFGSSKESSDKNHTIAQQARTAAVAQDALLDPAVTVKADKPLPRATLEDPAVPTVPPKTDSVIVEANTAVVTESRSEKP